LRRKFCGPRSSLASRTKPRRRAHSTTRSHDAGCAAVGWVRGDKALLRRADLRNAISVTVRGLSAFVGVPRKTVHGKSLADIAKMNEFGFGPIVIVVTEAMRRFLFALFRELGEGAGGGGEERAVATAW